jgi:ElaA protein
VAQKSMERQIHVLNMKWTLKKFSELTNTELYAILQLRSIVFVVEQNCPYLDTDDKDQLAWHWMGHQDDQLVAYTRLLPPGLAFEEASIGRVVTAPSIRRSGIGRILMKKSIEQCHLLFGNGPIQIGAQRYLETFYGSLGFEVSGSPYLEDGIPHIHMILR